MKRQYVESSNLKTVGYANDNYILEIEFRSYEVYQYFNVQEYVYNNLMNAESKGGYFCRFIRNSYPYKKVS